MDEKHFPKSVVDLKLRTRIQSFPPHFSARKHITFASGEDPSSQLFHFFQEFEIIINKIQGSLGFTLRKEDDSALGHYVRALVREPALTDGRIRAGDKIVAVSENL